MKEVLQELKMMASFFLLFGGLMLSILIAVWLVVWIFHFFFITLP